MVESRACGAPKKMRRDMLALACLRQAKESRKKAIATLIMPQQASQFP